MKISSALIVDDSEGDQILASLVLQTYNHEIELSSAYDGIEALDFLDNCEKLPQVIFLDMHMPKMDGSEFLQEFKRRNLPCVVVFMLTNTPENEVRQEVGSESELTQYINKPLELDDLLRIEPLF